MLKLDKHKNSLMRIKQPTLAEMGVLERRDLQKAIVGSWEAFREEIGMPELILLGEEIEPHQSCRDRIDMLALDGDGQLVVFELKRGSERLQVLQAISYAGMVSQWTEEDFEERIKPLVQVKGDDDEQGISADRISFGNVRVVLMAEAFDPEVILSADWLAKFDVPIMAFGITPAVLGDDILLSISQRFPLPGLEDLYQARSRRRTKKRADAASWDTVPMDTFPAVCRRAVEVLKAIKPGDPVRRRFTSMYSDGQFGGLLVNITKKHVKVYVWQQTDEVEQALRAVLGPDIEISTWGSEQTANSGFTFVLKTVKQFDHFVEAAKQRPG